MKYLPAAVLILLIGIFVNPTRVLASPNYTLNPTSKTFKVGENMSVMVGLQTGSVKSTMYDVVLNFDASKFELVSADLASNAASDYNLSKQIDNSGGKFVAQVYSKNTNVYEEKVFNGDLVMLTFKAKAAGTVNVSFVCSSGSYSDSNILYVTNNGADSVDKIVCSDNSTGVYTVTDSGTTTTTTVSTPTARPSALPTTGTFEVTLGLVAIGFASMLLGGLAIRL